MRNKRLDILRAVAILLVLGRHAESQAIWGLVGWAGVDLFFVLSGFLISGLLYSDYKKNSAIHWRRFLIRRGFKIYPAFYAMLLVSLGVNFVVGGAHGWQAWLHELFFVQNYFSAIWGHTWSLAVEEHFYLLLPAFLLVLAWRGRGRRDPFRAIPWAFAVVALFCLGMRLRAAYGPTFVATHFERIQYPTHLRIDALFFGVLLGYLHHFRPEILRRIMEKRHTRLGLLILSALCVSTCAVFPLEGRFILTVGLTLIYLGYGGLLVLTLYAGNAQTATGSRSLWSRLRIGDALAFMGMYSYSIYLWHMFIARYTRLIFNALWPGSYSESLLFWLYALLSLGLGIALARLVEFPALQLRDRLFPDPRSAMLSGDANAQAPHPAETALAR